MFQSTSIIETVSPDSMEALLKQRLRWFRNTCRRTLRAIFGIGEGFWVYKKPLALWHMLLAWTNTIVMFMMVIALYRSITSGYFYWWGDTDFFILLRWTMLFLGLPMTRFIRSLPGLTKIGFRNWRIILFLIISMVPPWIVVSQIIGYSHNEQSRLDHSS